MKILKTTITIEFENELNLEDYLDCNPGDSEEDAINALENYIQDNMIGHVCWAAENRLPSNMKLSYKFKWED